MNEWINHLLEAAKDDVDMLKNVLDPTHLDQEGIHEILLHQEVQILHQVWAVNLMVRN